jgi:hypothetical protein
MRLHGDARTCPKGRRLLVERVLNERWSVTAARMTSVPRMALRNSARSRT